MKKYLLQLVLAIALPFVLYSCSVDSENEEALEEAIQDKLESMVKQSLDGEYVLYTKVTVNSVDKTLLEGGCPTRVVFSWVGDSLVVEIPEMKIGNMPFAISYKSACEIKRLNSWEEDEHAGGNEAWFKFVGTNGYVSTGGDPKQNGSSIKGYFRPSQNIIEFVIDYNVMNVRTICERQTLDIERTRDYDTELAKYMEELNAYKKENGLNKVPTGPSKGDVIVPDSIIYFEKDSMNLNDSTIKYPDRFEIIGSNDITGSEDMVVSLEGIKGILSDDLIIYSDVNVGESQVATNCPAVMNFSWSDDVMTLTISNLKFGNMPFAINFSCICNQIYGYGSYYRFEGTEGVVSSDPEFVTGAEGVVKCYFYPLTMQIALKIDFGTEYSVKVNCPIQNLVYAE